MFHLYVFNDSPHASERCQRGLVLARAVATRHEHVRIYLQGDSVLYVKSGANLWVGHEPIADVVRALVRRGARVGACATSMDAVGIDDRQLMEGVRRSDVHELADWTLCAEKVLVF